jgi:hypothetical protein
MAWTSVANPAQAPRGMKKPQRCSICRAIVPMAQTIRHDREVHQQTKH